MMDVCRGQPTACCPGTECRSNGSSIAFLLLYIVGVQAKPVRNDSSNLKKEKNAPEKEKVSARRRTACMHFQRGTLDFSNLKDLKLDTETPPKKVRFRMFSCAFTTSKRSAFPHF